AVENLLETDTRVRAPRGQWRIGKIVDHHVSRRIRRSAQQDIRIGVSPRWGTVIEGDVPLDPDIDKFAGVRICVRMDTVAVLVEDDIVAREKRAGETLQVQAVSVPEVRSIPAVVVDDTARNLEIHEIRIRVECGPTV